MRSTLGCDLLFGIAGFGVLLTGCLCGDLSPDDLPLPTVDNVFSINVCTLFGSCRVRGSLFLTLDVSRTACSFCSRSMISVSCVIESNCISWSCCFGPVVFVRCVVLFVAVVFSVLVADVLWSVCALGVRCVDNSSSSVSSESSSWRA